MIRYQLRREGNDFGPPRLYKVAIEALRARLMQSDGPFKVLRPDSSELGPARTRHETLDIIKKGLKKSAVNDIWRVYTEKGEGIFFAIKVVEVGLPEQNPMFDISDGSPAIQKVARVAAGFDRGVRTQGIAYTRLVSGTNIWSQHSRWPRLACKSNAIDLCFPLPMPIGNDLARQRRLVAYLLDNAYELNIDMIISERTYWSRENGFAPRYYSGVAHVSHTHVQMSPYQTGGPC